MKNKEDAKILELPKECQKIVDHYGNLDIYGKKVKSPYYMNLKRSKDLRALVGKGTPEEIELETKIWAKLKKKELENMSSEEIRSFMSNEDIGIDCSGFVIHVLNEQHKKQLGKNIWRSLKIYDNDILHKIAYLLKPVEKLGAEIITNLINCDKVELKDVRPGDLIRSKWKRKNAHHVLVISKVFLDKDGNPEKIEYVNSTEQYGNENGIRFGEIVVKDLEKPLEEQTWNDADEYGVNHTLEGYMYHIEDNGLRRMKWMTK